MGDAISLGGCWQLSNQLLKSTHTHTHTFCTYTLVHHCKHLMIHWGLLTCHIDPKQIDWIATGLGCSLLPPIPSVNNHTSALFSSGCNIANTEASVAPGSHIGCLQGLWLCFPFLSAALQTAGAHVCCFPPASSPLLRQQLLV